jgi:N-acetylglutamate synthase-like GNAT family acetyltransferase
MIRIANKFDIPQIMEMLRHYRGSGVVKSIPVEQEETALKILTYIIVGGGLGLVSETKNKLNGMLLAIKTPYLWDNNKTIMSEIAYWVEPEHRGSTAGYRLLNEYVKQCETMKDNGKIDSYTISQMEGQNLNYSRFGFKPIEHTWSV